ncbi:MAG: type II toxin-antitoxin system YafQ family toxin [Deltaproteobacteria bacterium]|jgi:mRNA interferase YafQ|nr:type II toxin-antitoxin system YafQ family toxin [Deltaproteobacteria bacterium]
MRTIKWSTDFKKDYRRTKATPRHAQDLDGLLEAVTGLLVEDKPLPETYRDHSLIGNWKMYRECHLKPDLLLVYQTTESEILRFARLGSHSELFRG